jgi:hypothetical protein
MTKLIPNYIDNTTVSPGEIDFFHRMSKDEGAKDWVVLHSLSIAHHKTRLMGEIDFLVMIPDKGILAIEIKAHTFIKVLEGIWYMGRSDNKGSRRSPFQQVNESMFSLLDYISENNQTLKGLPIFSLVIFTHFNFSSKSVEWNSKDYVGTREYRSKPITAMLAERLKIFLSIASTKESCRWMTNGNPRPSRSDITNLVDLIRPSIELTPQEINLSGQIEDDLYKFTSEQFFALDMLSENLRVIFDGSAGTGKTFLAIESALREVKAGKKVLFVCMNKLLNQLLRDKLETDFVTVKTLHKLLLEYSELIVSTKNSSFWNHDLPENSYCFLLENEDKIKKFDVLIIDEAQDILENSLWLDCLDLLLRDGLENGRWLAFGDFNLQTIYNLYSTSGDAKKKLLERSFLVSQGNLNRNCRNIEDSSKLSLSLADLKTPYKSYLRVGPSIVKSSYLFYQDDDTQIKALNMLINKGTSSGFKPADIVILSKVSEPKSISCRHSEKLNVKPFSFNRKSVTYTSIHKFKGLEAPFIIITDFDDLELDESKKILFTGASRSTDSVHYLFHESSKVTFFALLMKGSDNE